MGCARSSTVTSGTRKRVGSHLNPQLRSDAHVPILCVLPEPETNGILPGGMVVLSHRSFLDHSIHILRIGLIGGAQVNLNGNMGRGGHNQSSLLRGSWGRVSPFSTVLAHDGSFQKATARLAGQGLPLTKTSLRKPALKTAKLLIIKAMRAFFAEKVLSRRRCRRPRPELSTRASTFSQPLVSWHGCGRRAESNP